MGPLAFINTCQTQEDGVQDRTRGSLLKHKFVRHQCSTGHRGPPLYIYLSDISTVQVIGVLTSIKNCQAAAQYMTGENDSMP